MLAKTLVAVAVLALASPVAAQAPQANGVPQLAVSYADLDLTTPAGEAALDGRIQRAVHALCPADPGLSELSRHRIATGCISETRLRVSRSVADAVSASRMARSENRQVAAR